MLIDGQSELGGPSEGGGPVSIETGETYSKGLLWVRQRRSQGPEATHSA